MPQGARHERGVERECPDRHEGRAGHTTMQRERGAAVVREEDLMTEWIVTVETRGANPQTKET